MSTTNTFAQLMLLAYLEDGDWNTHLEKSRHLYLRQAEEMGRQLERLALHGLSYSQPQGGFYYWVALPEQIEPSELLQDSIANGVLFATGDMFLSREADQPYIRLCFSHEPVERIEQGIRILEKNLERISNTIG